MTQEKFNSPDSRTSQSRRHFIGHTLCLLQMFGINVRRLETFPIISPFLYMSDRRTKQSWTVFLSDGEQSNLTIELSPRPHDTGMVTLAGTQNLNEFELHLRAVLGLPIPEITQERIGASAVILSPIASKEAPRYRGEEEVCKATYSLQKKVSLRPSFKKKNYKTLFQGSTPLEQQKVRTWKSPDLYFISINTRY